MQKITEKLMIFGKYQLLSINQNLFTGEEGCDIPNKTQHEWPCLYHLISMFEMKKASFKIDKYVF